MSLVTTPGILLRTHDYSESSRIMKFLTPEHGIVSLLARGSRRDTARGRDRVQTFGDGVVTFVHRPDRDLQTLRDFESRSDVFARSSGYLRLAGASMIAELLLVHSLQGRDEHLYGWIRRSFDAIGHGPDAELPGAILSGAWGALSRLGFPPELENCVRCGRPPMDRGENDGNGYFDRFDVAAGGLLCAACAGDSAMPRIGPEARAQLAALVAGRLPSALRGARAHLSLLEDFALHHLSVRYPFRTFDGLRPLLHDVEQDR